MEKEMERDGIGDFRACPTFSLLYKLYSVDLKFSKSLTKIKNKPCKQLIFSLAAWHQTAGGGRETTNTPLIILSPSLQEALGPAGPTDDTAPPEGGGLGLILS